MRFDDRLQTAQAMPMGNPRAASARWSQLIDLLAQNGSAIADDMRQSALAEASALAAMVPAERKRAVALAIGPRTRRADVVALLARESPQIAAPALLGARLSGEQWAAIIPGLPPQSRALLRERRDLPQAARDALLAFGRADLALPDQSELELSTVLEESLPPSGPSQISDLVARIDQWKRAREVARTAPDPAESVTEIASFRFETDATGIIDWVDGAPRAAIIGLSLAELADPIAPGVDGQAAGAFAKRAAIEGGRLLLPEGTRLGGVWLLRAVPMFGSSDGRFQGYRGVARRSDVRTGQPGAVENGAFPTDSPETVRQVVHELRTPLNAIRGFAEMIDGQVLGPVAAAYRERSRLIVTDAGRLLHLIETLDMVSRHSDAAADARSTVEAICERLSEAMIRETTLRGATLTIEADPHLSAVAIDEDAAVRLIGRLMTACLDHAETGERLTCNVSARGLGIVFEIDRPQALRDLPAATLLAPDHDAGADRLSLAFTLRLIRAAAQRMGAGIMLGKRFGLLLPVATASAQGVTESR